MKKDSTKSNSNLDTSWEPTGTQLLVQTHTHEEKTGGGLIVPDSAQNTKYARIEKVGKSVPRSLYSVGDEVIFIPKSAFQVNIPGYSDLYVLPYQVVLLHHRIGKRETEII